ncbi:MAG: mannose-1-phosphate guanylyltransferase/mannose-6-phosphate isomerase [Woeseiaceae bacterium]|nr:mannose-1-phosphate guanylyltransferase/mannose-6-phosphate isomerase [Woeseiaceae bacterium]
MQVIPVVLSGGSGTRLWPASRAMYPKQLLPLAGEHTMLQATVLRAAGVSDAAKRCIIVSNEAHRFSVAEQMNAIETRAKILLEPEGRNTAPAVALAAYEVLKDDDALMLVMPADHVIKDVAAFTDAVNLGIDSARGGRLVTFGIVPNAAETGYGYIEAEADNSRAVPVRSFVEKPDAETAEAYVESGRYFWNSGMFLFRASVYLAELRDKAPGIAEACERSMAGRTVDGDFVRPDMESFLASPSDSIDYAVMEKSDDAAMIALDAGWSDVGSWSALHDVCDKDDAGNSVEGDVVVQDCQGTYVQAESRLVAAVGLDDVIVVETKDAVLVAARDRAQDVKPLVEKLKDHARDEVLLGRQVFRPWGSYDSLENDANFQVKRLIVKPGAVLSLQKHAHRSEHWVVVSGKARITRNDEVFDLGASESTYIEIGDVHRIANPFDEPVHIIEVQCGEYLGEDDIVRLEDNYGREGTNS